MGIPICVDLGSHLMADSRGIWWWKKIVLGASWFNLESTQKQAVLLHEAAHCLKFHLEKRLLAIPLLFLRPAFATEIAMRQEIEADRFAAERGFGVELLSVLSKFSHGGQFYPTFKEREAALVRIIKERS